MMQTRKTESPEQRSLTTSQRAMAAARRMKELAPLAHQRQQAGVKVSNGFKGKASVQAAAEQRVSPRLAELARLVRGSCVSEVVTAVESGQITVTSAAKLAKSMPHVQRQAIAEVIKGRSAVEVLAEIGVQDRRLPRFDDDVLEQMVNQFKRLLDLRRATVGDHPCFHAAYQRLKELRSTVRQWTLTGPQGPPPEYKDRDGRPYPFRLNVAFRFRGQIDNTCYDIGALWNQISVLSRHDGGQCIPAEEIGNKLREIHSMLEDAMPQAACSCLGKVDGHAECGGRGWMPRRVLVSTRRY